MIKLNPDVALERETETIHQNRAICISLKRGGVKVWLKGKREFFTLPYDSLLREARRRDESICIPARKVSDSKLEKAKAAIEANRPKAPYIGL
jgi:hypothetical protein